MIRLFEVSHGNLLGVSEDSGELFEQELAQHLVFFFGQNEEVRAVQHCSLEGTPIVVDKIQVQP